MPITQARWVACVRCMRHGHFVLPQDAAPFDEVYSRQGAYDLIAEYILQGQISCEDGERLVGEVDACFLPPEVPEEVASQCIAPIINADQWVDAATSSQGGEPLLTCDRARLAVCRYYVAQIPELRLQ